MVSFVFVRLRSLVSLVFVGARWFSCALLNPGSALDGVRPFSCVFVCLRRFRWSSLAFVGFCGRSLVFVGCRWPPWAFVCLCFFCQNYVCDARCVIFQYKKTDWGARPLSGVKHDVLCLVEKRELRAIDHTDNFHAQPLPRKSFFDYVAVVGRAATPAILAVSTSSSG